MRKRRQEVLQKRVVTGDRERWDARYRTKGFALGKEATPFLKKHIKELSPGRALDLAAGEGRNAVFLARHGFDVVAVDISPVGLRKARRLARAMGVKIKTLVRDIDSMEIEKNGYDLIANFYFLNRKIFPRIKRGLKKGGKLIFETYTIDHRELHAGGPRHPRYYLKHNELLRVFRDFRVLFYREGIFREGGKKRAVASLIAEKV